MPVVFINGIQLNETAEEKLEPLLADKVGVSKCFLKITNFSHLLYHGGELIPVDANFDYTNYEQVTYAYTHRGDKYKQIGKCVPNQDACIVECNGQKFVMKKCLPKYTFEAVLLSNNKHPNIINLVDLYVHDHELVMIMEYAAYGDLFEYIAVKENDISEHYETIISQLVDVFDFLHSKNIAHLDLKPDNIVITSIAPFKIALIDFGYSKIVPYNTFAQFGTYDYMPPEIAKRTSVYIYDKDCDMWMLGVVILILYHHMLRHPFGSGEDEKFARGTENPRILRIKPFWPKEMPKKYENIASLLFVEREKRATIKDVKCML